MRLRQRNVIIHHTCMHAYYVTKPWYQDFSKTRDSHLKKTIRDNDDDVFMSAMDISTATTTTPRSTLYKLPPISARFTSDNCPNSNMRRACFTLTTECPLFFEISAPSPPNKCICSFHHRWVPRSTFDKCPFYFDTDPIFLSNKCLFPSDKCPFSLFSEHPFPFSLMSLFTSDESPVSFYKYSFPF